MKNNRGKVTYVPLPLLNLVNDIRVRKGIHKPKDQFNEVVKYARVGIEAENLHNLFFGTNKNHHKRGKGFL